MLNLMFWNIRRGSAESYLPAACFENDIDILILAEDLSLPDHIPALLSAAMPTRKFVELTSPAPSAVRFYSRFTGGELIRAADPDRRMVICAYDDARGSRLLITAVHLPSKLHADDEEQHFYAQRLRSAIEEAEALYGHQNSIVIGDFNMDPFDVGMSAANGLHGMMDRMISENISRTYAGEKFKFFYNPMWSRIGDESPGPIGTYFYNGSGIINNYWHLFDQVLIRPSLIPAYEAGYLKVVSDIGSEKLIKGGRIDVSISDHLPLVLQLNH